MRGGSQVKEALGFVTLLWNHPVLTGLLLLIFTPPFFPLVVYFSPLLMSTALCVVALVSVGSQMEKIKAEGGPGQQLETHLGRDQGVSTWVPPRDHSRNDQATHHYGENNRHRNLYANIHVVPAPPSWTGGQDNTSTVQLRPVEDNDPPTPSAEESDEDWWDTWVKEYESRPGWGDHEDQQPFRTPAAIPMSITSPAPAPLTIPTLTHKEDAPLKPEIRDENRPGAPVASAPIPAPVVAAPVAAPVSVSVVMNRQEAASRSLPPPPTTSTSRSPEEVVVSVKVTDFQPHIPTLAPIRTGRETTKDRQVDRIGKTPQEILAVPTKVEVPAERVSDVQALQSIEKLLHMEMGGSRNAAPVADVKNANSTPSQATSPGLIGAPGKGIAVEAAEKNRNKIAADIAGETPLLRHLKTSRSEKHSRNSSAFSPLPQRSSRGLMSEKVLPPPQFSPLLLQSLQPLPPKGLSPRPLPNLSTVPLGNPVEKIPQWVYDGIPKERAEKQAMKAETAEEKQVRTFEQAVKVLSYTRRRTHARCPVPIQGDNANLQVFKSTPTTPSLDKSTETSSRGPSPHRPASRASSPHRASPVVVASELLPTRISENLAAAERAHAAGDPHGTSVADLTERALPTPRASAAPAPRMSPSNPNGASVAAAASPRISPSAAATPNGASVAAAAATSPRVSSSPAANPNGVSVAAAASPPKASLVMAAAPRRASRASSPQHAPISASPRRASGASSPQTTSLAVSPRSASSPQVAPIAASPRRASSPQTASVAASPRPASSPQKAPIAASPRGASRAPSPQSASIAASSPQKAPIAASPQGASRAPSPQSASIAASSPQKAPIAASPRRASRASSPSIGSSPWPASVASPSPQKPTPSPPRRPSLPSSPSIPHPRRRRQHSSKHCTDKVAVPSAIRIEGSTYYDTPAVEKDDSAGEDYVPIEKEVRLLPSVEVKADANCEEADGVALRWGRSCYSSRRSSNSRRRLEPRRVVTSEDADMFCLKKSLSMRNGQTVKFVDSSSTTDDERESVTPRASRRSMGRTIKPLVWRSRSVQAHEDSD